MGAMYDSDLREVIADFVAMENAGIIHLTEAEGYIALPLCHDEPEF